MYCKSYKGFVIWLIGFIAIMLVICFLPVKNEAVMIRLLTLLCTLGTAHLTWWIWRTEQIYWYNGIHFEDAEQAGSERRKAYAYRYFRLFGVYALFSLAITLFAHLIHLPWWIDFTLVCLGLIVAAFRTLAYQL